MVDWTASSLADYSDHLKVDKKVAMRVAWMGVEKADLMVASKVAYWVKVMVV